MIELIAALPKHRPAISFGTAPAIRAAYVRQNIPVIAWAMLRIRNEHSKAFRGRYSPEHSPWGVEVVESQYWPHVRTVDTIGPPQSGKTFHACELPTLYDLAESRETVFYLNGSADNALNIWSSRWLNTMRADPVLREQILTRMEAGRWEERHFRDGGVLYSAGPESAAALSQKESRIVRCSELEKTKSSLGAEASSYKLACDRAAAYPADHMITSDCTVTERAGISWRRFASGDRSRPFIPCPSCGHYASPAHARHLEEIDLCLSEETAHILEIHEARSATDTTYHEGATLACKKCGAIFSNKDFRLALRAVVWVPVGCKIVRHDDPLKSPIPKVSWLDSLNAWAAEQLAITEVCDGKREPKSSPISAGPRLPDGVTLEWDKPSDNDGITARDPRQSAHRSFWIWRIIAPRYSIEQVAKLIVDGEVGDMDDQKTAFQKDLVLPWIEPALEGSGELNEDAVMLTLGKYKRLETPHDCLAITCGIDIGEKVIHFVKRGWASTGATYLMDYGVKQTSLSSAGLKRDLADKAFITTRQNMVTAALDAVWAYLNEHDAPNMTYIDSGHMSEEVYQWVAAQRSNKLRPVKGLGSSKRGNQGQWTDACEKKAMKCRDAKFRPLRHQYYSTDDIGRENDQRRLVFLHADHWKKEVHAGIKFTALHKRAQGGDKVESAPWFFIFGDMKPTDAYVSQVVAERWEEALNPKTNKIEIGWKDYWGQNHLLDAEAYAFAAAAERGVDLAKSNQKLQELARPKKAYGIVGKSYAG